jgi:hypothetical protein
MPSLDPALETLQAELKTVVAQLNKERKAKDEAVKKLETVVAEINSSKSLQIIRADFDSHHATTATTTKKPLYEGNQGVTVGPHNMLIHDRTIKTIELTIHGEPADVLASLKVGTGTVDKLRQKVLKGSLSTDEVIVYWTFVDQMREYVLLLRLKVQVQDAENETRVGLFSISEEELDETCFPVPPLSSTTRSFRLHIDDGTIILRPLPFGQTSFTFIAQIRLNEVEGETRAASENLSFFV